MKKTLLALGLLALLLGVLWYPWRSGSTGPQAGHEESSLTEPQPQGIEPPGTRGGRTEQAVPIQAPSKPVKEPLFWSFFLCDPAGKGIPEAHLELRPADGQEAVEITLDSRGRGRIPLERPTTAFVSAHAPGFQGLRLNFSGPPAGKGLTRLVLVPLANVPAIRVVEQDTGNPLKGALATDSKGRKLGTTDGAGRLVLKTWNPRPFPCKWRWSHFMPWRSV